MRCCGRRSCSSPRRASCSRARWRRTSGSGGRRRPIAEVEEAARAIGAHAFIAALPDGYATKVGKRGGKLSAGQRQLLSFCRAFIAAPSVLVLDEATALLDIPSERLVQSALRTVLSGRTAVIIAHRLSTVAIADRVLVLRAGEIIEDGSPAELMRAGTGEYADLHARWAASLPEPPGASGCLRCSKRSRIEN